MSYKPDKKKLGLAPSIDGPGLSLLAMVHGKPAKSRQTTSPPPDTTFEAPYLQSSTPPNASFSPSAFNYLILAVENLLIDYRSCVNMLQRLVRSATSRPRHSTRTQYQLENAVNACAAARDSLKAELRVAVTRIGIENSPRLSELVDNYDSLYATGEMILAEAGRLLAPSTSPLLAPIRDERGKGRDIGIGREVPQGVINGRWIQTESDRLDGVTEGGARVDGYSGTESSGASGSSTGDLLGTGGSRSSDGSGSLGGSRQGEDEDDNTVTTIQRKRTSSGMHQAADGDDNYVNTVGVRERIERLEAVPTRVKRRQRSHNNINNNNPTSVSTASSSSSSSSLVRTPEGKLKNRRKSHENSNAVKDSTNPTLHVSTNTQGGTPARVDDVVVSAHLHDIARLQEQGHDIQVGVVRGLGSESRLQTRPGSAMTTHPNPNDRYTANNNSHSSSRDIRDDNASTLERLLSDHDLHASVQQRVRNMYQHNGKASSSTTTSSSSSSTSSTSTSFSASTANTTNVHPTMSSSVGRRKDDNDQRRDNYSVKNIDSRIMWTEEDDDVDVDADEGRGGIRYNTNPRLPSITGNPMQEQRRISEGDVNLGQGTDQAREEREEREEREKKEVRERERAARDEFEEKCIQLQEMILSTEDEQERLRLRARLQAWEDDERERREALTKVEQEVAGVGELYATLREMTEVHGERMETLEEQLETSRQNTRETRREIVTLAKRKRHPLGKVGGMLGAAVAGSASVLLVGVGIKAALIVTVTGAVIGAVVGRGVAGALAGGNARMGVITREKGNAQPNSTDPTITDRTTSSTTARRGTSQGLYGRRCGGCRGDPDDVDDELTNIDSDNNHVIGTNNSSHPMVHNGNTSHHIDGNAQGPIHNPTSTLGPSHPDKGNQPIQRRRGVGMYNVPVYDDEDDSEGSGDEEVARRRKTLQRLLIRSDSNNKLMVGSSHHHHHHHPSIHTNHHHGMNSGLQQRPFSNQPDNTLSSAMPSSSSVTTTSSHPSSHMVRDSPHRGKSLQHGSTNPFDDDYIPAYLANDTNGRKEEKTGGQGNHPVDKSTSTQNTSQDNYDNSNNNNNNNKRIPLWPERIESQQHDGKPITYPPHSSSSSTSSSSSASSSSSSSSTVSDIPRPPSPSQTTSNSGINYPTVSLFATHPFSPPSTSSSSSPSYPASTALLLPTFPTTSASSLWSWITDSATAITSALAVTVPTLPPSSSDSSVITQSDSHQQQYHHHPSSTHHFTSSTSSSSFGDTLLTPLTQPLHSPLVHGHSPSTYATASLPSSSTTKTMATTTPERATSSASSGIVTLVLPPSTSSSTTSSTNPPTSSRPSSTSSYLPFQPSPPFSPPSQFESREARRKRLKQERLASQHIGIISSAPEGL